jgi:hypothetical protein
MDSSCRCRALRPYTYYVLFSWGTSYPLLDLGSLSSSCAERDALAGCRAGGRTSWLTWGYLRYVTCPGPWNQALQSQFDLRESWIVSDWGLLASRWIPDLLKRDLSRKRKDFEGNSIWGGSQRNKVGFSFNVTIMPTFSSCRHLFGWLSLVHILICMLGCKLRVRVAGCWLITQAVAQTLPIKRVVT